MLCRWFAALGVCAALACSSESQPPSQGAAGSAGSMGGASGASGVAAASGAAGSLSGAGGSAGSAGNGASGAGGLVDPCASALFCDDFESYATGQAPSGSWSVQTRGGAVRVDDSQHASGTRSVLFTTQSQSGTKTALIRLAAASVFPLSGNVFYGRMLFQLAAAPETSVHWTLIQAGGLVPGQSYHALYRYGGQLPITDNGAFLGSQWMANYDTPDSYSGSGPSSDCWLHANGHVIPVGRWSCVQWQFDGPNNTMRFWLDGVSLDDLTMSGTGQGCIAQGPGYVWTAPSFDHLDLGWESYQTDTERNLWIDDVAIAEAPVACPP